MSISNKAPKPIYIASLADMPTTMNTNMLGAVYYIADIKALWLYTGGLNGSGTTGPTLASGTVGQPNATYNEGSGKFFGLVSGVQSTITGAASTITSGNLTKNMALISNGNGKVWASTVTSTELGHLEGVEDNIQEQLDGKLNAVAKGETQSRPLAFGGTFKVLQTLADGTVNERVMTLPAQPSFTNNYLTSVTGSGNGTVTFNRQGLSAVTWNASHNHDNRYYTEAEIDNTVVKLTGNQTITGIKTINSSDLRMNGGSVAYIRPNTTGGWARGFWWQKNETDDVPNERIGGIGVLGNNLSVSKFYIGYGTSPWTSSALEVFPDYTNAKGLKVNNVDVVLTNDSRLTNSRPASDVQAWAKSSQALNEDMYLKVKQNAAEWITASGLVSDLGLATVASTGSYTDLTNTPTSLPASDVQAWAKSSQALNSDMYLRVKQNTATWVTASTIIDDAGLATVASTGSYEDLTDTPTSLPASDVQAWAKSSQTNASSRFLRVNSNNATWRSASEMRTDLGLKTVASSGSYTDLINQPSIPSNLNDLSDVSALSPSSGQILTYTSLGTWEARNKPSYVWSEIGSKPSWIGSSKPTYNLDEINEGTTYKRVTQSEKNTWNNGLNLVLLRSRSGTNVLTIHSNTAIGGLGLQLSRGDTIMFEVSHSSNVSTSTPKVLTATIGSNANSASHERSITYTTWSGSEQRVYSMSVALISNQLTFGNANYMRMYKSDSDMIISNSTWTPYIGRVWKVVGV